AISTAHGAAESSRLTTSRLDVPTIASTEATGIPVETAAASPAQAEGASRKRPVWPITVAALLLIALACGVLVYMLARSRSSSESKSSATAPTEAKGSGEEVAQVNGAESKSGVQQPAPTSSVARPESSVDRATQERSALNHLSEEAAASNANAIAHAAPDAQPEQPKPNTKPAGSVTDHYKRGLDLWGQNRQAAIQEFRVAAQSNPDAYYYLGLNLAEGRDPHVLQRAELVAALQYFQLAQRGAHRAEAAQYAERLGREYDRRRNQR
ncbi:MAG TPA: hypothetical protein VK619_08945, partial [Pyrinomonadaceae bacterium]|nr:hypothetical protein [Pyrinomonadaceae bacterium]